MNHLSPSQQEELIEKIGDIAHESYLGCSKYELDVDRWWYGYSDEVVNLLRDSRVSDLINEYVDKAVIGKLDNILQMDADYQNSGQTFDFRKFIQTNLLELKEKTPNE